jgi:hypothetical protein
VKNPTYDTVQEYNEAIERCTKGIDTVSVGACPGCKGCGLPENPAEEELDAANSDYFSWRSCELCGSPLGGSRHPCHGFINGELWHGECCADCLLYFANGDLPEHMEDK